VLLREWYRFPYVVSSSASSSPSVYRTVPPIGASIDGSGTPRARNRERLRVIEVRNALRVDPHQVARSCRDSGELRDDTQRLIGADVRADDLEETRRIRDRRPVCRHDPLRGGVAGHGADLTDAFAGRDAYQAPEILIRRATGAGRADGVCRRGRGHAFGDDNDSAIVAPGEREEQPPAVSSDTTMLSPTRHRPADRQSYQRQRFPGRSRC
jgi:hypothetical protein